MSAPADIDPIPEFSHPIEAEEIPGNGKTIVLSADAEACAALAKRLDLAALNRLEGRITLRPLAGGPMIVAAGELQAELSQRCVVTLDPIPVTLKEGFAIEFGPPEGESLDETEREFTLEDPDPPEEIIDGIIDLGEVLAQQLALMLDPHPRKPGVDLDSVLDDAPAGRAAAIERDAPSGPFAALAKLKK